MSITFVCECTSLAVLPSISPFSIPAGPVLDRSSSLQTLESLLFIGQTCDVKPFSH